MATKAAKGLGKQKVPVTAPEAESDDKNGEEPAMEEKESKMTESSTAMEGEKGEGRHKEKRDNKDTCRDFLHNRCDRGAFCKFSHNDEDAPNGRKSPEKDADGRAPCRDFMRNVCRRGADCRYYHPTEPKDTETANQSSRRPFWLTFCHDFQNGHCSRGDCRLVLATSG